MSSEGMEIFHLNFTNELILPQQADITTYKIISSLKNLKYLLTAQKRKFGMASLDFPGQEMGARGASVRCPGARHSSKPLLPAEDPDHGDLFENHNREERKGNQVRGAPRHCSHYVLCKLRPWSEPQILSYGHHFASKSTHKPIVRTKSLQGFLRPGKQSPRRGVVIAEGLESFPFATQRDRYLPPASQ